MVLLMRWLQIDILDRMQSSFIRVGISAICAGLITLGAGYFVYNEPSLLLLMGDVSAPLSRDFADQFMQFATLAFLYASEFLFLCLYF